jgi:hypothetical protein
VKQNSICAGVSASRTTREPVNARAETVNARAETVRVVPASRWQWKLETALLDVICRCYSTSTCWYRLVNRWCCCAVDVAGSLHGECTSRDTEGARFVLAVETRNGVVVCYIMLMLQYHLLPLPGTVWLNDGVAVLDVRSLHSPAFPKKMGKCQSRTLLFRNTGLW